jgi:hypothetical protein
MAESQQPMPAPTIAELADSSVPTFYISSISASSNEAIVIGNELYPTWGADGATQAPVLRPRLVIRFSPPSVKYLADVLNDFVAGYEANYGELRANYLLPTASQAD